jgi:putative ABC transport system ATP-binding protein
MLLEVNGVSKTYRDASATVQAVHDVSLQVAAGQFVAVRGPSGCGKSTLLLTVGGLLQPDSGEVVIDGQNPYLLSSDQRADFRANHVGFVFQQFHLIPYLNVLDNILAPALATSTSDAKLVDRAEQLMEHFGLSDRRAHVPSKLSSGERQRTAMARSLLNKPGLLLADEPTGNLDHENADTLLRYLSEFAADGGGVLLVTHDDRAVDCADEVINMQDGGISITAAVG